MPKRNWFEQFSVRTWPITLSAYVLLLALGVILGYFKLALLGAFFLAVILLFPALRVAKAILILVLILFAEVFRVLKEVARSFRRSLRR